MKLKHLNAHRKYTLLYKGASLCWGDNFQIVLNVIRSSDVVRVNNYGLDT